MKYSHLLTMGRLVGLCSLVLVSAVGVRLAANYLQGQQDDVQWLQPDGMCRLGTQPCRFGTDQGALQVMTSVAQFETGTPFELVVALDQLPAEQIWVQLEGVDMFMGISRYRLLQRDDGAYAVTLRLPTCSEQTMTWRAHVMAQVGEQTLGSRFEFQSIQ